MQLPQTYIVAQTPEVLAHLMKENETRGFCPSAYNTPASVFNTVAVDFDSKDQDDPILKTSLIPVQSLQKLDPEVHSETETQMKQKTACKLERTPSLSSTESTSKMGSLERKSHSPKMNSLETNQSYIVNSLDRAALHNADKKSYIPMKKISSFDCNPHVAVHNGTFSPKMGSLERNTHISHNYPFVNKPDSIQMSCMKDSSSGQFHNDKNKQIEESIYDFGGADVKSCAHKVPFYQLKSGPSFVESRVEEFQVWIQRLLNDWCALYSKQF